MAIIHDFKDIADRLDKLGKPAETTNMTATELAKANEAYLAQCLAKLANVDLFPYIDWPKLEAIAKAVEADDRDEYERLTSSMD